MVNNQKRNIAKKNESLINYTRYKTKQNLFLAGIVSVLGVACVGTTTVTTTRADELSTDQLKSLIQQSAPFLELFLHLKL